MVILNNRIHNSFMLIFFDSYYRNYSYFLAVYLFADCLQISFDVVFWCGGC